MNLVRIFVLIAVMIISGCDGGSNNNKSVVLVSTDWLQSRSEDPSLVILHVGTWGIFDSVHIPGARYIDPYDFTESIDSLRNELPELSTIVDVLRLAGINKDSRIVLYYEDEGLISRTARVFMTLDYIGLGNRSHVLNGGLTGWVNAGLPTSSEAQAFEDGDLAPGDVEEVVIKAQKLTQQRWNPDYVIIDSRTQEEYHGELDSTGLIPTGGHIEGAYFMNYETVLSDTTPHMFRENSDVLEEYKRIGMDQKRTTVYYCGSGIRASTNYLMARHLGYPALLYDGSYEEWEDLGLPLTSPVVDPSTNN